MKIFHVQWGCSDYEIPRCSVYVYAKDENTAKVRAIVEFDAEADLIVEEIEVS